MMNLMHWRMLVAVADTGNITRAAERVGMTQSGASQALALLEDNLGVQLFTRENRQTLPTAVGEQVVEQARLMLAALQNIRDTADACRDIQRGTIRLASFPMVLATFLPPLLRRFKQLYPGIQVVALEVSDDEVEALLEARLIDVGVLLNPAPERSVGLLGRDAWVAVLPAGHALARRAQEQGVTLQELVGQPFVLATGGLFGECPQPGGGCRPGAGGCAGRGAGVEQRLYPGSRAGGGDAGAADDLAGATPRVVRTAVGRADPAHLCPGAGRG